MEKNSSAKTSPLFNAFDDELRGIVKEAIDPAMIRRGAAAGGKFLRSAADVVSGNKNTIRQNLTGAGRALKNPVEGFKAGLKHIKGEFSSGGNVSKAMLVGGTALGAPEVMAKDDPRGQGRSRVHRGIQAAASTVGGVITAPFGLSGGLAGSAVGDVVGHQVGKTVDRFRGLRRATPTPTTAMVPPATAPVQPPSI